MWLLSVLSHLSFWGVKCEEDGQVFFSLDDGATKFTDLIHLVEFYQLNRGVLPCKLKHPCTAVALWHSTLPILYPLFAHLWPWSTAAPSHPPPLPHQHNVVEEREKSQVLGMNNSESFSIGGLMSSVRCAFLCLTAVWMLKWEPLDSQSIADCGTGSHPTPAMLPWRLGWFVIAGMTLKRDDRLWKHKNC